MALANLDIHFARVGLTATLPLRNKGVPSEFLVDIPIGFPGLPEAQSDILMSNKAKGVVGTLGERSAQIGVWEAELNCQQILGLPLQDSMVQW